jgi:hypothetical protein
VGYRLAGLAAMAAEHGARLVPRTDRQRLVRVRTMTR